MKSQRYTHLFISGAITLATLTTPAFSKDVSTDESLPTPDELSKIDTKYSYKTEYETSFLPGIRFCEDSEADYWTDFREVNCQDEELINAVSTRKEDSYNTKPSIIVNDRIEPNGNLLRIYFRKKVRKEPDTSDN